MFLEENKLSLQHQVHTCINYYESPSFSFVPASSLDSSDIFCAHAIICGTQSTLGIMRMRTVGTTGIACLFIKLLFYIPVRHILLSYGDVIAATEWLQNFGLFLVKMAFEQGGIFIVPHLLLHGASVFAVSSEGLFLFSSLFTKIRGIIRAYSHSYTQGTVYHGLLR